MKKIISILLFTTLFTLVQTATADVDKTLYQGTVPVASQSQSDWQLAVPQALSQVLIKLSNNPQIIQMRQIQSQIKQASNNVESYSYITNPTPTNNNQNNLMLQVQFYPQAIDQLLQQAGINHIQTSRPLLLIWLVVQNQQGLQFVSNDSSNPLVAVLQDNANRRGMPILFPMLDLQDLQNVTTNDVWQLNPKNVLTEAKRYSTQNVLEGKLFSTNGQWQAQWILLRGTAQPLTGSATGNTQNQAIAQMIDQAANNLTTTITASHTNSQQQVILHISNVNGLDDYADILKYLHTLSPVAQADVTDVNPDSVTVTVNINGGITALTNAISTSSELQPITASDQNTNSETDPNTLYFRWTASKTSNSTTQPSNIPINQNNNTHNTGA